MISALCNYPHPIRQVEVSQMQTQLSEKLFNQSFKSDTASKHTRDLVKSEIDALRADVVSRSRTSEADLSAFRSEMRVELRRELNELSTKISTLEKDLESGLASVRTEFERSQVNKIKWTFGILLSCAATSFAAYRAFFMN